MKESVNNIYSHDDNAVMMTIPEAQLFLKGAVYYGPLDGADTKLYEKQDKWYRVTIPCLSCLGITQYDNESPIVELLEISSENLL